MEYRPLATKQVIVVRKELGMRKGKIAAQVAHASLSFLTRPEGRLDGTTLTATLTAAQAEWLASSFAKIVVWVDSEAALMDVCRRAEEVGVEAHLVLDAGRTEFTEPTYTCCAVGPDWSERVDLVTGGLPLL